MLFSAASTALLAVLAAAVPAPAQQSSDDAAAEYEYVVVGSGAGGGTVASRLARNGHKVLLIEAGDDATANVNTTVPAFQTLVSWDEQLRWDFYVNHYQDQSRAQWDPKYTWRTGSGPDDLYVGLTPPAGAEPLGILYPRSQTLGGCVTHNALIYIRAHDSDWDNIAILTDDDSWRATEMKQYEERVRDWLSVEPTDPTILLRDLQLVQQLTAGAAVAGAPGLDLLKPVTGLANALLADPNANTAHRDSTQGFFPIPLISKAGTRNGVRENILDTVAQGFPLTVKTNTFVTKVNFDTSGARPKAVSVDYLEGSHLYRASPLSGARGTPGTVKAKNEIILAGGTYNTPQLLMLSGIGPKDQLAQHGIPVLHDLPGVGTNMQDRYEIGLNVKHENPFAILDGCTFTADAQDKCFQAWNNNPEILAARGAYATNGLAATMVQRSKYAADDNVDLFIFASPSNFTGYFPNWGKDAVADPNHYSWYTLKAHTRNHAGTVTLRSADPLDVPQINFNYFDTGTTDDGADQKDLGAMVDALKLSRKALGKYHDFGIMGGSSFVEQYPGPKVQSDEELGQYIKNRAWGHHASCTNPIGSDDQKNAVLDSNFNVRGVDGLRVVDASAFPTIPGVFITSPILTMAEKAAQVIHDQWQPTD